MSQNVHKHYQVSECWRTAVAKRKVGGQFDKGKPHLGPKGKWDGMEEGGPSAQGVASYLKIGRYTSQ